MTAQPALERSTRNPYVGPRPLRRLDPLFGRDREVQALTDLLISERIVLLHAPSGAGKTSLIQAAVIPRLEREGFVVSGPLRLNGVRPENTTIANRYVWSAVDGLLGNGHAGGAKDVASLEKALATVEQAAAVEQPGDHPEHVIILDQFEEILTLEPTGWDNQREFFQQLGLALEREDRWALLSMREDYMGGLEPYSRLLPTRLDVRFRLDFLKRDAARLAMRGPAEAQGVRFTDEATELLAADLSTISVQDPVKGRTTMQGPYVEPVQLQVVCETLWRRLERKLESGVVSIDEEHIRELGELDLPLGTFYADVVDEVARTTGASESAIRDWFGEQLITDAGFRSQSNVGPTLPGIDASVVLRALEDRYLIRSDERNTTRWYELSHDRLVDPVLANNDAWLVRRASSWELRAHDWQRANRNARHLLRGDEIRQARLWIAAHDEAGDDVREYLDASTLAWAQESIGQRVSTNKNLSIALALETIVLIALLLMR